MRKVYGLLALLALLAGSAIIASFLVRPGGDAAKRRATSARVVESGPLFSFPDAPPKKAVADLAPSLSLTASDGTGLELTTLEARGILEGSLAFTELRLTFRNPQDRTLEGRFRITLPQGAAISRFAMRKGDDWQEGEVVEKEAAQRVYEDFLHRRQDPALLEQAAGNEFSARVFPIPAKGRKELIVSYSQEVGSETPYTLALRGLPVVERLDAVVTRPGDDAPLVGQIHLENAAPDRDLVVDAANSVAGEGLRAGELVLVRVVTAGEAGADALASCVILVDTSASRSLGYEAQIDLVGALLAKLPPAAPVVVAAFDQGVDAVYEGGASGWVAAGPAALRHRQAFGASDVGAALRWAAAKARAVHATRVVLVTDGVPTAGEVEPAALRPATKALAAAGVERLDAVAVGGIRDDALLHKLTTAGFARDGVVVDGSRGAAAAFRRLSSSTSSATVTVEGARWQWPHKLDGVQPGDEILVYAEVPPSTQPRVRIGEGAPKQPKLAEVDRPLLERAWARAKIGELLAQGSKAETKAEIVRLSTTYRVLSPFTALLVLESENDFARYHIDRRALSDILTFQGTKLVRANRTELVVADTTSTAWKKETERKETSDGVVLRAPPQRRRPPARPAWVQPRLLPPRLRPHPPQLRIALRPPHRPPKPPRRPQALLPPQRPRRPRPPRSVRGSSRLRVERPPPPPQKRKRTVAKPRTTTATTTRAVGKARARAARSGDDTGRKAVPTIELRACRSVGSTLNEG